MAFFKQDAAHLSKDGVLVIVVDAWQGGYIIVCSPLNRFIYGWCGMRSCLGEWIIIIIIIIVVGF